MLSFQLFRIYWLSLFNIFFKTPPLETEQLGPFIIIFKTSMSETQKSHILYRICIFSRIEKFSIIYFNIYC